ncbi:MAG TPA: methylmalonyl-CoA epimerase [Candidatus Limnocylindria bacterium]|nr:methylmalonyl-CoA epimerase [Candidatus Limnocylindria bacterium]
MLTRVHHVGLVVRRLEDGLAFWQDRLGLAVSKQATVADQGVRAALLPIGRSEIELLEPISNAGGVGKFLERRGEGLHHVCFETADVASELAQARERGFPLIDQAPRPGLAGMICFLHPKGTAGVLVEFATPPAGETSHAAHAHGPLPGLALREVTAQSKAARDAAALFEERLGLARTDETTVSVGGVRLHFVAGEAEGLSGLVLELPDAAAAARTLADLGAATAGGMVRLPPERCHGVPISIVGS